MVLHTPWCVLHLLHPVPTTSTAPSFFYSYVILTTFILLNVIIGIVLDNFEEITDAEASSCGIDTDIFPEFERFWFELDVTRSRLLHVTLIRQLLKSLPEKFRSFKKDEPPVSAREIICNLHVAVIPGDVVSLSHVWVNLLYLHHPLLVPFEVMDRSFVGMYKTFTDVANVNVFRYSIALNRVLFLDELATICYLQLVWAKRSDKEGPYAQSLVGKLGHAAKHDDAQKDKKAMHRMTVHVAQKKKRKHGVCGSQVFSQNHLRPIFTPLSLCPPTHLGRIISSAVYPLSSHSVCKCVLERSCVEDYVEEVRRKFR